MTRLRAYLTEAGFWDDAREEAWQAEASTAVQEAVDRYLDIVNNQPQGIGGMFDYMYQDLPHDLIEQKAYAEAYPEDGGHH